MLKILVRRNLPIIEVTREIPDVKHAQRTYAVLLRLEAYILLELGE